MNDKVYVQFGCGGNRLDGFHNHDSEVDITKRLPYDDNSVDFVFIEHCVEHISGPQVLGFFEEVYRILKHGGVFRLCIPVLDHLKRDHAKDIIRGHGHLTIWSRELTPMVLWAAGFPDDAIIESEFKPQTDGHHRVIGVEKDAQETARYEATK